MWYQWLLWLQTMQPVKAVFKSQNQTCLLARGKDSKIKTITWLFTSFHCSRLLLEYQILQGKSQKTFQVHNFLSNRPLFGNIVSLRMKWIFIGSSYIYYPFLLYFRQMALKLALSMLLLMPHMQAIREDSRPEEAAVESVFTVSLPKWGLLTISFTLSSCSAETWNYSKWLYVTEDFNLSNSCITLNKWLMFT